MARARKMAEDLQEPQELSELLGFQIHITNIQTMNAARTALEPFGVTPARLTALLLIRTNEGCDQSTLGRALRVNRSSAMKLVNLLIGRGLVERRQGRNLRSHALHLTPVGRTRLDAMIACVREADRRTIASLSGQDRAMLGDFLSRVRRDADLAGAGEAEKSIQGMTTADNTIPQPARSSPHQGAAQ